MQEQANVSLSAFELELVSNPEWILTKNRIIQKVMQLLGAVNENLKYHPLVSQLPPEVHAFSPKISKGENYQGLPYVILDYPRLFSRDDVFAIRCFFWWGHYFTCTLHLKGKWKELYLPRVEAARKSGKLEQAYINRTGEEWAHQLDEVNWQLLQHLPGTINEKDPLLKIAFRCNLSEWNEAPRFLEEKVTSFLEMLLH
jgi:hypothetical protein